MIKPMTREDFYAKTDLGTDAEIDPAKVIAVFEEEDVKVSVLSCMTHAREFWGPDAPAYILVFKSGIMLCGADEARQNAGHLGLTIRRLLVKPGARLIFWIMVHGQTTAPVRPGYLSDWSALEMLALEVSAEELVQKLESLLEVERSINSSGGEA